MALHQDAGSPGSLHPRRGSGLQRKPHADLPGRRFERQAWRKITRDPYEVTYKEWYASTADGIGALRQPQLRRALPQQDPNHLRQLQEGCWGGADSNSTATITSYPNSTIQATGRRRRRQQAPSPVLPLLSEAEPVCGPRALACTLRAAAQVRSRLQRGDHVRTPTRQLAILQGGVVRSASLLKEPHEAGNSSSLVGDTGPQLQGARLVLLWRSA